jgi:hypothetical protein
MVEGVTPETNILLVLGPSIHTGSLLSLEMRSNLSQGMADE